ncbi:MAG: hypothetical protein U1E50_02830 [Caulobacteraceae bacterium]
MTLVSLENPVSALSILKVIEDFGSYSVQHSLAPGENIQLPVSRFKAVVVIEAAAGLRPRPAPASQQRNAFLEVASPRPQELRVG